MRLALLISILPALAAAAIAQTTATAPSASAPAATASAPASRPATNPAKDALYKIQSILSVQRPNTREEYETLLKERVPQVLAAVEEMGKQFHDAKELGEARMLALAAASQLGRATNDPRMLAKAEALAKEVLASTAAPETKLYADAHLLLLAIRPLGTTATRAADNADKLILDFTAKYAKTPLAPEALRVGMDMADLLFRQDLVAQLEQTLVKDYPSSPLARQLLRRQGKSPDVGRPFTAELTRLDGTKLSLPQDLLGKVVVLDFWATWNGPSVVALPELKELYAKYKDKGVQFVGISLDADRQRLAEFVKVVDLQWIQTFSGKALEDPTVKQYGVRPPSVWVIGPDGKVISDNATLNLPEVLDKALAGAASRPEKGP